MKKLTKIQKFAQGKPCHLRVPGICRTTPENEDVVLAHAPYPGRGGTRLHDWWGCPACMQCHDAVDGRGGTYLGDGMLVLSHWMPAIHEWQARLIEHGLLIIKEKM